MIVNIKIMLPQKYTLKDTFFCLIISNILLILLTPKIAFGEPFSPEDNPPKNTNNLPQNSLDLPPEMIQESPVLQRWLKEIPDVLDDIHNDPSFRTVIRIGYTEFPSTKHDGGLNIGVKDIFIGKTGLTISGDYQTSFGDRDAGGVDLQYYLLPLGSYINVAPSLGYRAISTNNYSEDGINIGGKVILPLSRTGASDISFSQRFISPGNQDEVGITNVSFGYALTKQIRLSTEIEKQNSRVKKDSQVSIMLEWMP
ncbi:hypothetical protein PCC8801_0061 [Rippkaea orientalis PCC 8801]|uniref:Uncharacterized protein n=1 Tax=Rippkaea orientalis (strain PCC 8801 / RF-1) TaxID=41431 RepID=B7K0L4_RIPO1|nr:hypothetical protein [Rippkaea orientalis]ACK64168.1 hypothetical protein PCC8801_0061 [Rippkaea orientalis PCC 8801]